MFGYRVRPPDFAHHGQRVAIQPARQIAADRPPIVAAIVTAEELVPGEIEPLAVVRADDERRVPVVALRLFGLARDRRDAHSLASAFVESHQSAVLALGIDGVRVFGIDARDEAVAAVGLEPIGVDYARLAARFGRAA